MVSSYTAACILSSPFVLFVVCQVVSLCDVYFLQKHMFGINTEVGQNCAQIDFGVTKILAIKRSGPFLTHPIDAIR